MVVKPSSSAAFDDSYNIPHSDPYSARQKSKYTHYKQEYFSGFHGSSFGQLSSGKTRFWYRPTGEGEQVQGFTASPQ